jgi:hypothetical protein
MVLKILLYFIVCLGFIEIQRRSKTAYILVFFVVPFLGLPWIIKNMEANFNGDLFLYAKIYSVVIGAFFMFIGRFTKFGETKWYGIFLYTILAINILEAMIKDSVGGHFLNAISGLLVILTAPAAHTYGVRKHENGVVDNTALFTRPWILFYTFWNITFVYNAYNLIWPIHIALLGAPLLITGFFRPEIWIMGRVLTLGPHVVFRYLYFPIYTLLQIWEDSKPDHQTSLIMQGVTLALGLFVVYQNIIRPRLKKGTEKNEDIKNKAAA